MSHPPYLSTAKIIFFNSLMKLPVATRVSNFIFAANQQEGVQSQVGDTSEDESKVFHLSNKNYSKSFGSIFCRRQDGVEFKRLAPRWKSRKV